jgi:release factor glutamine methyltransferase
MPNNGHPNGPAWTVLKALRWTTDYFSRQHVENPRASAEILLSAVLGCRRIDLYLQFDQPLHKDELSNYRQLIKRRMRHEPVSYITGEKEFWSLNFIVTPAVLIPRPETEIVVEKSLKLLSDSQKSRNMRILEPGTGSGAISVSMAYERPQYRYFASDLSLAAIAVARQNAQRHGALNRILFFVGNWFDSLRSGLSPFDLVVCNPPYVRTCDIETLQPDIRHFEPHSALDGGADGFRAISSLIDSAHLLLKSGGFLVLEIGYDQCAQTQDLGWRSQAYDHVETVKDYHGHLRVVCMRKR